MGPVGQAHCERAMGMTTEDRVVIYDEGGDAIFDVALRQKDGKGSLIYIMCLQINEALNDFENDLTINEIERRPTMFIVHLAFQKGTLRDVLFSAGGKLNLRVLDILDIGLDLKLGYALRFAVLVSNHYAKGDAS